MKIIDEMSKTIVSAIQKAFLNVIFDKLKNEDLVAVLQYQANCLDNDDFVHTSVENLVFSYIKNNYKYAIEEAEKSILKEKVIKL